MKLDSSYFEEICDNFARRCPTWIDDVVKCVPRHGSMIRAVLKNGDYIDYDDRTGSYRYVTNDRSVGPDDVTDEDCRDIFATNLVDLMRTVGVNQAILAERSGLSQVMISKYIKRKATPSFTNVKKIAHALNCSIYELIE